MSESLQAISEFRDKNSPEGLPQYVFWPQVKVNGTWSASPTNLVHTLDKFLPSNLSPKEQDFLTKIGLRIIIGAAQVKKSFIIPPDNDDSSVNLALLGMLKETSSPHYEFWNSLNYKKNEYYQTALKYAYRPFGPNMTLNKRGDEIDPRTYYILRGFFDKVYEDAKVKNETPSLILPSTWLLTED